MTLVESHGLANRPGEPYPATFRIQWTHWESNPDFQPAELVSSRLTMSPKLELTTSISVLTTACRLASSFISRRQHLLVERRGIEPRLPGCKPSVFPLDQRPIYFISSFALRSLAFVASVLG